jgi:hypothetical protein
MTMGVYKGPCDRCGEYLEKRVAPGRRRYHIECGIAQAEEQNRGYHDGTHPSLVRSVAGGNAAAEQIRKRNGIAYTRWVGSMSRYLESLDDIESDPSAILPGDRAEEAPS